MEQKIKWSKNNDVRANRKKNRNDAFVPRVW